MAYAETFALALGTSQTGLTLKAALVSTGGTIDATLRDITTGFTEIGLGNYQWYYASFADAFRGSVVFYTGTLGAASDFSAVTVKAAATAGQAPDTANAVRTELTNELGRLDVAVSTRLSTSLSSPILSTFSLLTGLITDGTTPLGADANEAIAAAVAAESTIAAKLALIGTGSATVSTPVAEDGQITSAIVIGDDYLAANGRAFEWTIDEITGITAATASCQFGASHRTKGSFLVTGTITDNGSTWTLSFDVTRTDTADCEKGEYDWSVQVTDASGNELTRVRNATDCYKVQLVEKQT